VKSGFISSRHVLSALVVGGAIVFLGLRLARQGDAVAALDVSPRWGWIATAAAVLGLWFALRALLWTRLMGRFGERLDGRRAAALWFASELGRYVPGAGWHFVARALLSDRLGVRPAAAVVASLIELGMAVLAAAVLALLFIPELGLVGAWPIRTVGLLLVAVVVIVQGPLVSATVSAVLKRFRREPLSVRLRLSEGLRLFPLALGAWLAHGVAFVLLARGLGLLPAGGGPAFAGAYAAAWLVGVLVVVAPGGLGVRENVLAWLLLPVLAEPEALVLVLVARLWVTAAEVGYALFAVGLATPRRH
jgi:hypothetical protein